MGGAGQVLLFTDGGFNAGARGADDLARLVRRHATAGVHLTVAGVRGQDRDATLDALARWADGSYLHLQDLGDARRSLIDRLDMVTCVAASDVKLQLFFNPRTVRSWKQVGYRERWLRDADFNDDRADAGELGSGQRCTALYQLVPVQGSPSGAFVDPNPFLADDDDAEAAMAEHLVRVRVRARHPGASHSALLERDLGPAVAAMDTQTAWAAAVARFGQFLAEREPADRAAWDRLILDAAAARGADPSGRRAEAIALMTRARDLRLEEAYAAAER